MLSSRILSLIALTALLLSSCTFGNTGQGTATTVPAPTAAGVAPTSPAPPTAPPAGARPTVAVAISPTTVQGRQRFRIEERSSSDNATLSNLTLVVRSAELSPDGLSIRVAFQNTSDKSFSIVGTLSGRDARLIDAAGKEYEPSDVSESLRGGITPEGGFGPGVANAGTITFPPPGNGPYELRFPRYETVRFQLDTPLNETAFTLAEGTYAINQNLRSGEGALIRIELQVRSLEVTADSLIFEVAFSNASRQGFDLMVGPKGEDALLLDGEGVRIKPSEVSDSLKESIEPKEKGGWLPGQENVGTITFPRPEMLEELRFVFPSYDALTLRMEQNGIAEARVTSPSGGAPQPTPTPSVEETGRAELEQLLATQAQAQQEKDVEAYLRSFDPALHDEQRQIFERAAKLPLENFSIGLRPTASILEGSLNRGEVNRVEVQMSYQLRGVVSSNVFTHDLLYNFTREGDTWRVSQVKADRSPPFWYLGDLTVRETPHFLLVARPELEGELADLEQETETAYAALKSRGLPLEQRYVAYFTASQDDFRELTGQASNRALGVALSRYSFDGAEVVASSYAFYINGEAFAEDKQTSQADRQTTITHELVHLVLAPGTRPYTPVWVAEGAAVYFSEDLGGEKRQRLVSDGKLDSITLEQLTRADTLGEHDVMGQQVGYEYTFSGETFAYLVETFGKEKTLEFYNSFADVPAADVRDRMPVFGSAFAANTIFADLRGELTTKAVQEFFGVSLEQLDTDVKAWLRK